MPSSKSVVIPQRKMAMQLLKAGQEKVWFNPKKLTEIEAAKTRADIKRFIYSGDIKRKWSVNEFHPAVYDKIYARRSTRVSSWQTKNNTTTFNTTSTTTSNRRRIGSKTGLELLRRNIYVLLIKTSHLTLLMRSMLKMKLLFLRYFLRKSWIIFVLCSMGLCCKSQFTFFHPFIYGKGL